MTDVNLAALEREIREAELEALDAYERGVAEAPVLYKAMGYKATDEGGGITTFVASEESEDRMGDVLEAGGWELREFRRNPVFMLNHNYSILPIGTVPRISVQEKQLIAHVKWDEDDELAAFVKGKYQRGVMRGVSVGFRPLEWDRSDKGMRFKKQELLELSAVSVPAHPHALAKAMSGHLSIIRPEIITVEEPGAPEPGLSELDQQIIMAALARFKEALR